LAEHVAKAILLENCLQLYQYKYGWIGACDCLVESGQSDGITARTADPKAQPAFLYGLRPLHPLRSHSGPCYLQGRLPKVIEAAG
jgi:hypothetical protein